MDLSDTLMAGALSLAAPWSCVRRAGLDYAGHGRGKADLYLPRRPMAGAPAAVFFYGGSWDSGDRNFYRFVGQSLAGAGIATLIPDYRVHPEANWPAFVEDAALAARYARDEAAGWGADPAKLFLIGHSAGAYNALMVALEARWLAAVGMSRGDIAGVAGLSGPYDFMPTEDAKLAAIFGPQDQWHSTQPVNLADGQNPPVLLVSGGQDRTVSAGQTVRLFRAISAAGGEVTHNIHQNLGHRGVILSFLPLLRHRAPIFDEVTGFIAARAGAPARKAAA